MLRILVFFWGNCQICNARFAVSDPHPSGLSFDTSLSLCNLKHPLYSLFQFLCNNKFKGLDVACMMAAGGKGVGYNSVRLQIALFLKYGQMSS